jgi:hypothetical protein
MRKNTTWLLIITTILLTLLNACISQTGQVRGADECLETFEVFAYHVPEQKRSLFEEDIYPLPPWEIVSRLPGNHHSDWKKSEGIRIIRSIHGQDEIWVGRRTWTGQFYYEGGYRSEIMIYHPENGKWERTIITGEIEDTGVYVWYLYETSDGALWSSTNLNTKLEGKLEQIPMLSQFNEEKQGFEFAPGAPTFQKVEDVWSYFDWPIILLDQEDIFWIFIPNNAIYSYDTKTHETKKHTSITDIGVQDVVLAPDGSLYFRRSLHGANLQEEEVFRFFPESGEVVPIEPPHESWPDGPIFVDSKGNLWFGAIGYRTPEGSWHLLHPDPEGFFTNVYADPRWATPHLFFESSNGLLWFSKWFDGRGDFGMAWYDPTTGEGCWFTTQANPRRILEDSQYNLWLVMDGKLYKYALES